MSGLWNQVRVLKSNKEGEFMCGLKPIVLVFSYAALKSILFNEFS